MNTQYTWQQYLNDSHNLSTTSAKLKVTQRKHMCDKIITGCRKVDLYIHPSTAAHHLVSPWLVWLQPSHCLCVDYIWCIQIQCEDAQWISFPWKQQTVSMSFSSFVTSHYDKSNTLGGRYLHTCAWPGSVSAIKSTIIVLRIENQPFF